MKKISFLLTIIFVCSFVCSAVAQTVTSTKINGHKVSVTYTTLRNGIDVTRVTYDGKELATLIKNLELACDNYKQQLEKKNRECKDIQKQIDSLQAILASQSQSQVPSQSHSSDSPKADATVISLKRDKLNLEDQRDSLQGQVKFLNDSIRLLNAALEKVYSQQISMSQKASIPTGTFQHVGAYYRIGSPWLINNLLDKEMWCRQVTLSHQIGVYWNSASFSDKLPMTYGAGLEYSRMKFSAGIGYLSDTLYKVSDKDYDRYTAYLTYNDLRETTTLHYLSIPLTFSIGAPRADRISGYFQVSLVTSILLKDSLSASGKYSCMGHYDTINHQHVNFDLTNFPALGFVENEDIVKMRKNDGSAVNRFVWSGRLSGGVYIPLSNTTKGQTSQWVVKLGANLDLAFTNFAKEKGMKEKKGDTPQSINIDQYLSRYKIFSGSGSRFINPSLEIGILYIFNK